MTIPTMHSLPRSNSASFIPGTGVSSTRGHRPPRLRSETCAPCEFPATEFRAYRVSNHSASGYLGLRAERRSFILVQE